MKKEVGSGSISYDGSGDPDPHQKCHGSPTLLFSLFFHWSSKGSGTRVPGSNRPTGGQPGLLCLLCKGAGSGSCSWQLTESDLLNRNFELRFPIGRRTDVLLKPEYIDVLEETCRFWRIFPIRQMILLQIWIQFSKSHLSQVQFHNQLLKSRFGSSFKFTTK